MWFILLCKLIQMCLSDFNLFHCDCYSGLCAGVYRSVRASGFFMLKKCVCTHIYSYVYVHVCVHAYILYTHTHVKI